MPLILAFGRQFKVDRQTSEFEASLSEFQNRPPSYRENLSWKTKFKQFKKSFNSRYMGVMFLTEATLHHTVKCEINTSLDLWQCGHRVPINNIAYCNCFMLPTSTWWQVWLLKIPQFLFTYNKNIKLEPSQKLPNCWQVFNIRSCSGSRYSQSYPFVKSVLCSNTQLGNTWPLVQWWHECLYNWTTF